jgi:hypothetical protein
MTMERKWYGQSTHINHIDNVSTAAVTPILLRCEEVKCVNVSARIFGIVA